MTVAPEEAYSSLKRNYFLKKIQDLTPGSTFLNMKAPSAHLFEFFHLDRAFYECCQFYASIKLIINAIYFQLSFKFDCNAFNILVINSDALTTTSLCIFLLGTHFFYCQLYRLFRDNLTYAHFVKSV